MANFFKNLKQKVKSFDIYDNAKILFIIPLIVVLIMLICGTCYQMDDKTYDKFANIGVDFQGGTLLTVEFSESGMNSGEKYDANLALITEALNENGLSFLDFS